MRQLLVLPLLVFWFSNLALAQQPVKTYDYKSSWKKVEGLSDNNLPESALKQVNEIYTQAQKDKNDDQLVKSLIHILKFTELKEEDDFVKNIDRIEKEIKTSRAPVKQLLHSMLAQIYWNYYENNRYRFSDRSKMVAFKNTDVSTWSLDKIFETVLQNYKASLTDANKLKEYKNGYFAEVIEKGNKLGESYRPTLYDFLAHRAIDFFKNTEPEIIKPAYAFTINNASYLAEASEFVTLKLESRDTLSNKFQALKLYQDILTFHISDPTPDALMDADLQRLEFVYQNLTLINKEEIYLQLLKRMEQKYANVPAGGLVAYQVAEIWSNRGNKYNASRSPENRWDKKKAWDICQHIIDKFPDSRASALAYNLQISIKYKSIEAIIEKVNIPLEPIRALVSFKNFDNVYYRVIKTSRKEVLQERKKWENNYNVDREKKFLEHFLAKSPVTTGNYTLPSETDLQEHSAELAINPLPVGDYMVIFSSDNDFDLSKTGIAYAFTSLSNISFLNRNLKDGSTEILVLNRTTGEPLANAALQVSYSYYNNSSSKYETAKGPLILSNTDGKVVVPLQTRKNLRRNQNNFFFDIKWNNDSISSRNIDDNDYGYSGNFWQYPTNKPQTATHTSFFLDRAIYRPGQTLYFKGLVYATDGKTPQIVPNHTYTVTFYDVNSQVVAQKTVTTNDYGTFNGTITTPTSGLTGNMRLLIDDTNHSQAYFSVEEYKRPKFEVSFEPIKGSFRLNDTIKTTGKAMAYSGAAIDGAPVKYRVVRRATFPFWWWCRYGYYPSSPEMEITNGETQTRSDGTFDVKFNAIPDESVARTSDPVFYYTVFADVTDINGETHSSSAEIGAGYKSLRLNVSVPGIDISDKEASKTPITVTSNNLSGNFVATLVDIKISRLTNPEKAYRSRLWQVPDTQVLSQAEYNKLFPNDAYGNDADFYKWPTGNTVYTGSLNTGSSKTFTLPKVTDWKPGKYKVELAATDSFGQPVSEVAYFDITNNQGKTPDLPEINQVIPIKTSGEPGDKASFSIGSSGKTTLLYELELDGTILESRRIQLNNNKQLVEIPILESYRGNVAAHFTLVKDNRSYTSTNVISVPFTNKQLDISFETFRDKLQPGATEQWKLKIKGKNGEKAAAELVATLYDASLDAFRSNSWYANFYTSMYSRLGWNNSYNFEQQPFRITNTNWNEDRTRSVPSPDYAYLNWFGLNFYGYRMYELQEVVTVNTDYDASVPTERKMAKSARVAGFAMAKEVVMDDKEMADSVNVIGYATNAKKPKTANQPEDLSGVTVRKNFNETAFFFPTQQTDSAGEIIINFTIPEALTRWKMLGFAHTKELASGSITNQLVTQKDLMVVPNAPRFFRENDRMKFPVKITSLTSGALTGVARLEFFDALTMKSVNSSFKIAAAEKPFDLKPGQSTSLEWDIEIPEGLQAATYRVVAKAGNFSDGEENTLPVVTNRMLITETLPLPVRGTQTKTFTLDKLVNNTSTTLRNQRFTLEFTSNPAWYAVQALPYLMEYPYECTEQTFSRYYANALASHIVNTIPKIKQVFDTWKNLQPDALLSNLEKNQELKSALLEETPWVLEAKDESTRKRNIALLFDLNRMADELGRAIKKIKDNQGGNGGFSWFPGLPEDIYITQHIISGMGHLSVLGVKTVQENSDISTMVSRAIAYADAEMDKRYQYLKAEAKKGKLILADNHLGYLDIHYLYARSFFTSEPLDAKYSEASKYYMGQAKKYWMKNDLYMEGMLALALFRNGDVVTPAAIVKSLRENALFSEEMGMYWKFNRGYYWYQAPIETQSLMVEVFEVVAKDTKAVSDLQTWLLKQKQTQDWGTTKATSDACYALLLRGTDLLSVENQATIKVGNQIIDPNTQPEIKTEAGTGYFKKSWDAAEITPDLGKIEVTRKTEGVSWGAVYWQYFEQLDKITPAVTPLQLKKMLFLQQNTDRGPVITPVTDCTPLKPGDLIKVRIELRVDRTMEYVHLKDMRAAAFEPVETLSTYKYQDGLWYYESPRDLATNFFIGWLPKGTYVFEYALRVSQKGNFSNGVTTIQCMYAPEFASHSEGIRVKVE